MSFTIERSSDVSTVRIVDQLVGADRPELRRAVLGELADGARTIRFDFAGTTHIDGAGLGLLVSLSRQAREHATELRLVNLSDELRMLFTLTKLDTLFTIESDADDGGAARPAPLQPRAPGPMRGAVEEERPRP